MAPEFLPVERIVARIKASWGSSPICGNAIRGDRVGAFDRLSPNGDWLVFDEGFDTPQADPVLSFVEGSARTGALDLI
jgi:hypothetical protein